MTQGGSPVQAFFGALLMAIGGLIAALSGLCTAVFMVGSVLDGGGGGNIFAGADVLVLSLVVGGIPIAIGLGMFFLGRTIHRNAQPPPVVRLEEPPDGPAA